MIYSYFLKHRQIMKHLKKTPWTNIANALNKLKKFRDMSAHFQIITPNDENELLKNTNHILRLIKKQKQLSKQDIQILDKNLLTFNEIIKQIIESVQVNNVNALLNAVTFPQQSIIEMASNLNTINYSNLTKYTIPTIPPLSSLLNVPFETQKLTKPDDLKNNSETNDEK